MLTQRVFLRKLESAERTGQKLAIHSPILFTAPPMKKANGKMKAAMRHATRIPCSLPIMRKLAKHGMNPGAVVRFDAVRPGRAPRGEEG